MGDDAKRPINRVKGVENYDKSSPFRNCSG